MGTLVTGIMLVIGAVILTAFIMAGLLAMGVSRRTLADNWPKLYALALALLILICWMQARSYEEGAQKCAEFLLKKERNNGN